MTKIDRAAPCLKRNLCTRPRDCDSGRRGIRLGENTLDEVARRIEGDSKLGAAMRERCVDRGAQIVAQPAKEIDFPFAVANRGSSLHTS